MLSLQSMIESETEVNPLVPAPLEILLVVSFLLGLGCTVYAAVQARRQVLPIRAAVAVGLLNLVPCVGPLIAVVSLVAWRLTGRRPAGVDAP